MGLLDGRVAVVTGSGRGIGREFALCFAREGAHVVDLDLVVENQNGDKAITGSATAAVA